MEGAGAGPGSPSARRTAGLLAASALGGLVVAVVAYLLAVRTAPGQRFEDWAFEGRKGMELWPRRALAAAARVLTPLTLVAGTGAVAVVAVRAGRTRLAPVLAAAVAGAVATATLAKAELPREVLHPLAWAGPANTFPSGHVTVVAAVALAAVVVAPAAVRTRVAALAAALAAAQVVAVLGSGWHRPADAVGGLGLAVAWVGGATAAMVLWRGAVPPGRRPPLLPTDRAGRALVAAVPVATVVLGVLLRATPAVPGRDLLAFVPTAVGSAVLASLAALGLRWALGDADPDPPVSRRTPRPATPRRARPGTPGS